MKLREYFFVCKENKNNDLNYYYFFLCTQKSILVASYNSCWTTDVTCTVLTMPFWTLDVVVALLSMQGQKAHLCYEDQMSYRFGMNEVIN